jgi:uncharacterized protein (TIGR01777 family)
MALSVLVSGASGMIGTSLCAALEADGHTVVRLVRRPPGATNEITWDPTSHVIERGVMDRADAVVNLSGASLGKLPWTAAYKRTLLSSRVHATRTLTDAMRLADDPPAVFLSASAVGFYGDRPGDALTEDAGGGTGFLTDLVRTWENTAQRAPAATRVVTFRSGLVIGHGGAMAPLLPLARVGLAGPIGTGRQHWPWISLPDEVRAIRHLMSSQLTGAVNLAAPTPTTAATVVRTLAAALHRPYGVPAPQRIIELVLRDAGREMLLGDQTVIPTKLVDDGFTFEHETIAQAIEWLLSR